MSYQNDDFWDTFTYGMGAGRNFDPQAYLARERWRQQTGQNYNNNVNFETGPTQPYGLPEKIWGGFIAGILWLLLLPLFALSHAIIGPFRKNLRWPRLTRTMSAIAVPSWYCWSINPSFHRIEDSIGAVLTFPVQWGYILFLLAGVVAIPAAFILVHFRKKAPKPE